jgi:hypothetical protein
MAERIKDVVVDTKYQNSLTSLDKFISRKSDVRLNAQEAITIALRLMYINETIFTHDSDSKPKHDSFRFLNASHYYINTDRNAYDYLNIFVNLKKATKFVSGYRCVQTLADVLLKVFSKVAIPVDRELANRLEQISQYIFGQMKVVGYGDAYDVGYESPSDEDFGIDDRKFLNIVKVTGNINYTNTKALVDEYGERWPAKILNRLRQQLYENEYLQKRDDENDVDYEARLARENSVFPEELFTETKSTFDYKSYLPTWTNGFN